MVPYYPIHKTWIREYACSLPIIAGCVVFAFVVMLKYFQIEANVVVYCTENPSFTNNILMNVPGVIYAILVLIMSHFYRKLAIKLNDWENHKSQESHENHLIFKFVVFEFFNNFVSLFYVAFVIQDIALLRKQLITLLIVFQILDNIQEVLIPLFTLLRLRSSLSIKSQAALPPYESTYYDFLELFLQFGFCFLFAYVAPLAPLLAFLNNLLESRTDIFKLCYGHRRPLPPRAASSVWQPLFRMLAMLAIVTNCALYHLETGTPILTTVIIEHVVLAFVMAIEHLVPEVPKAVRVAKILSRDKKRN